MVAAAATKDFSINTPFVIRRHNILLYGYIRNERKTPNQKKNEFTYKFAGEKRTCGKIHCMWD